MKKYKCYCHDVFNGDTHHTILGEVTMEEMTTICLLNNPDWEYGIAEQHVKNGWSINNERLQGYLLNPQEWNQLLELRYKAALNRVIDEI